MLRNWMRRMGRARLVALATIAVFTGGVLVETADARARGRSGGGFSRSFGNRGSRSFDNGQQPNNRMQPLDNRGQTRPQANGVNGQNNRGSWLQRNPLMAGIMGAIAGTVIGSMLMNAFGGMGGMGGFLMLFLGGLALFAVYKMFKGRQQQPALGGNLRNANFGGNSGFGNSGLGNNPNNIFGGNSGNNYENAGGKYGNNYGGVNPGGVNTQTREQGLAAIALEDASMSNQNLQDVLTTVFFQVQEAWTNGDRRALANLTSGEVYSEFTAELDEMDRRNERNVIKNIVMRSFDITEAWQEGDVEYVTGYINARLLDYTERSGQVVEGDAQSPTQFSEYWTFVRSRGRGDWKLSAINQEG